MFLLSLMALLTSCMEKEETGLDNQVSDTKEISFSLDAEATIGLLPTRSVSSIEGMCWKLFCFDDEYRYLFEQVGMVENVNEGLKVSVPKGQNFRFLFLFAKGGNAFPSLEAGSSYWDLPAYAPALPISDPLNLLVSRGGDDGTLRVAASTSEVSVSLAPRVVRLTLLKEDSLPADVRVESITFADAVSSVPYMQIEPLHYGEYGSLPEQERTNYEASFDGGGICYMLPDMCGSSLGTNAILHVSAPGSDRQEVQVEAPEGMALNAGAGKNYYIALALGADGKLVASWQTKTVTRTLRMATQNLWGKPAATVMDYFNKIDVDVLCAQECSGFSDAEIQAEGLYVHSHTNNGQGRCSIISRYPFEGTTPNGYGVYIDLGDGIEALVMNCHGAYKPYGPYQLSGIDYGGYPATDDVEYVVRINKEVRQEMVGKLLEDVASATTPFISISGDFNEPSWLDWTAETVSAGSTPYAVQWPTTYSLWEGGIKGDAYRTIHPDPVAFPGYTWTPFPSEKDMKDRLDLTLYKEADGVSVRSCQVIGEDAQAADIVLPSWPFDHRGVRTEFVYER